MKEIISEAVEKLKEKLEALFSEGVPSIACAETQMVSVVSETVTELLSASYEAADAALLADREWRREAGLQVERRGQERTVLTLLGEVNYCRTYYKKVSGGYCHPVDELAGVGRYERLSESVGQALVEAARTESYARSSLEVTGGRVSQQTVMHKIRQSRPADIPTGPQKRVAVLHVDADEDHVKLQTGQSTIVPLVSIYEGIERRGKRGCCKNVFHRSRYGETPDQFWEGVLEELELRYDLTDTAIYLHGDGASWINRGLEWLPNSRFVLDRYHKNKAIKRALSGIDRKQSSQYEFQLRKALNKGDRPRLYAIRDKLLERYPEREETIRTEIDYLLNNLDAIVICSTDPEATNGGATEPHVSHILSARLSSRPMGWSRKTLQAMVAILAAEKCTLGGLTEQQAVLPSTERRNARTRPARILPFTAGLPHPDTATRLPGKAGKVTPLFNALRPF